MLFYRYTYKTDSRSVVEYEVKRKNFIFFLLIRKRGIKTVIGDERLKNKIFQSRDLCLRALDTNSACAKSVRRNEEKNENG